MVDASIEGVLPAGVGTGGGFEIVATEVGGVVERAEFDEESLGGSGVEIRKELEAVDPLGDARIDAVIEGLHAGAEEAVEEELRLDHRAGGDSESGADVAFPEEGFAEFEEGGRAAGEGGDLHGESDVGEGAVDRRDDGGGNGSWGMARELTQDGTGFGERVLGHVGEFVFDFVFCLLGPDFGVFDVGTDFLAELAVFGVGVAFDVMGHSEDAGLRVDF